MLAWGWKLNPTHSQNGASLVLNYLSETVFQVSPFQILRKPVFFFLSNTQGQVSLAVSSHPTALPLHRSALPQNCTCSPAQLCGSHLLIVSVPPWWWFWVFIVFICFLLVIFFSWIKNVFALFENKNLLQHCSKCQGNLCGDEVALFPIWLFIWTAYITRKNIPPWVLCSGNQEKALQDSALVCFQVFPQLVFIPLPPFPPLHSQLLPSPYHVDPTASNSDPPASCSHMCRHVQPMYPSVLPYSYYVSEPPDHGILVGAQSVTCRSQFSAPTMGILGPNSLEKKKTWSVFFLT